jgi:hypothetical protein
MGPSSGLSIQSSHSSSHQTPPAMMIGTSPRPNCAHLLAQLQHALIGRLGLVRVLGVGQAVMAAGQPGVLVDHAAQQLGHLGIAALPQRREGPAGRDDGVVEDIEFARDLGELVGHAGAAGDAVDQPLAPSSTPRIMRSAPPISHSTFMWMRPWPPDAHTGLARLGDAAGDAVGDQLLMPGHAGTAGIGLADDVAFGIIAVGIDAGEGADAAGAAHSPAGGSGARRPRPCRLLPAAAHPPHPCGSR